jgi:hypothetical protein
LTAYNSALARPLLNTQKFLKSPEQTKPKADEAAAASAANGKLF